MTLKFNPFLFLLNSLIIDDCLKQFWTNRVTRGVVLYNRVVNYQQTPLSRWMHYWMYPTINCEHNHAQMWYQKLVGFQQFGDASALWYYVYANANCLTMCYRLPFCLAVNIILFTEKVNGTPHTSLSQQVLARGQNVCNLLNSGAI